MNEDLKDEQQRVQFIMNVISNKLQAIEGNKGSLKEEILELRKNFWEDVTVNMDEDHEIGETFTSIKQQSEMLSERERNHKQVYNQINNLHKLKQSPYFGRIDFTELPGVENEVIYIGIRALMDEHEEDFLIYDWRAPIASLYYDYGPGEASYATPAGIISGEISLKRQFIIKEAQIKALFDTGITIGDELLQEVLGTNASTQMKSIVATIQKEQNQIIRNERSRFLIVQGVAGSGKTSAALQRVAYLLYRYRKKIGSEDIVLFSPNPLFNSYVAKVLPELGEDSMKQTTFQQYLEFRLGNKFSIEDSFTQMEYVLTAKENEEYKSRLDGIQFKSSIAFKELIDSYVANLSKAGIIFKDIRFRKKTIVSASAIEEYFYSLEKSISIPNRMQLVSEWLLKQITQYEKKERSKDWVQEEMELLDKEDYLHAFQKVEKKRVNNETFNDHIKEEFYLAKWVVAKRFKPIKQAIKRFKFINTNAQYVDLFHKAGKYYITVPGWNNICSFTEREMKQKKLPYEDATPFLYLQEKMEGRQTNTQIKHVFIDEAQDYSPFQFAFLRQLFPTAHMTILGDLNQAIYMHSFQRGTILETHLDEMETITLKRSYRSTRQIVDFTKGLVENGNEIEPFNREGEKPVVIRTTNDKHIDHIQAVINECKELGYETIAVICKTEMESKALFQKLNGANIKLMKKETAVFDKGVLILPAYLAKGIEFDAVLISDCSANSYFKETERNLFYTACTRAMHDLRLFCLGEKSPFFHDVYKNTYNEINMG